MVGRYMLNMGVVEGGTRLLVAQVLGTDQNPIFKDTLVARIGFVRKKFPQGDTARHKWAMNAFDVAERHAGFRNIVAHSPLMISATPTVRCGYRES